MSVATSQISGKVFRFLSAMHPALSKAERKRYAGYDPDNWYPWTPEVSAEFTDLMRRSPRDTSFARGFAYVAQRAIPEGGYVPVRLLFDHLQRLPAAYRGPEGSGFAAEVSGPGRAVVNYSGMPGFANVCIAIQGELTQRIQATGAQGVVVRHGRTCRVNGAPQCEFEVEWATEVVPSNARALTENDLPGEEVDGGAHARHGQNVREEVALPVAPAETEVADDAAYHQDTASTAGPTVPLDADLTGEDLFFQLRKRLSEADRQARLYQDARSEVERLKLEVARSRAQADSEIARARKERDEALEAVVDLKRRIRSLVTED